ncbi:MAG: hypothetical protein LBV04_04855 [Deferribacteraceae bacterium]|jgi:hypothetical protein|nr:hypothetical protein [Deferribacteraceae bacterium]
MKTSLIVLSKDEALILSDVLHRISEMEDIFPDLAERQILWSIEGQLDKMFEHYYLIFISYSIFRFVDKLSIICHKWFNQHFMTMKKKCGAV